MRLGLLLGIACSVPIAACSAITHPDLSQLEPGGHDAGSGMGARDAGQSIDAYAPEVDAGDQDVGMELDANRRNRDATTARDAESSDGPRMCPPSCDDGVSCTMDSCVADACAHVPNDALCDSTHRCDAVRGCIPRLCRMDVDCDDHNVCNGLEQCLPSSGAADPSGCVHGTALNCNDAFACTTDSCDAIHGCQHVRSDAFCADAFDCTTQACSPGGTGSDSRGCLYSANSALCNGVCRTGGTCVVGSGCVGGGARDCRDATPCTDDSCDPAAALGCVHTPHDGDGDSYPAEAVSGMACSGGTDCDDTDRTVNPAAMEMCNGHDDNCNGTIDEGCVVRSPDTCTSAQAITFALLATSATVHGVFSSFSANYSTSCGAGGGSGPDAVYYVDVPNGSDLVVDSIGSVEDVVLAVSTTCGTFSIYCNDDYASGTNDARIFTHRLSAGIAIGTVRRVFILVSAYSASATGAFTLNVHMQPTRDDGCGAPIDISGGGSLVAFATNMGTYAGTCGGMGKGEGVASFDASPGPTLVVDSADFTPVLYTRFTPCATGAEIACDPGASSGGGISTATVTLGATTVTTYVFVDGSNGSGQRYVLRFTP